MDNDLKHDPMDQYQDENVLRDEETETVTDTAEVQAAEESAMNTDTDIAREANEEAGLSEEAMATLEEEAEIVEEALEKKKGRESTSEKSKKAAAERTSKGSAPEPIATKQLDPLRLRGKKYRAKVALVDRMKQYSIEDAVELVKQISYTSFDAAVEVHIKVKADAVRGMIVLPHGTGKTKKVAVANDETLEAIAAGKLDFEILLATPAQMPKLAKFAKVLGPKGLMPSPKAGTVTDDIEKATAEISGGRVEYRVDKNGVVHNSIGRVSFKNEQLVENFRTLEAVLISSKIESISIAPTMGPGIKIALSK
jgi:large subunit ribosomal protein L1